MAHIEPYLLQAYQKRHKRQMINQFLDVLILADDKLTPLYTKHRQREDIIYALLRRDRGTLGH